MAWTQVYDPAGSVVLSALSAAIPLMVLFYMLAIRRAKGHVAAIVGLAVAFVLAVALWGMPFGTAVSSVAYGMANGLFPIVWIVITAVWVYNMTVESGEFEIIKDSLARLTDDRRLQALFIAFAFGAFLEGTAGFGTPVAITAAMLAGIGFNPLYAAGLCLIANTAPVAFGAIGVPVIVAGQVSGFDPNLISAIVGRQLPFLSVIVPLWLCVTMCGFKRSMEVLPAILVAGLCFAISQFVFSNYHGPTLPDIMSAIITLVGLVILLRFWKPATIWRFEGEKPTVLTGKGYSFGEVIRAWIPFIILAVMVFFWGLPQFKAFLDGISGSIATKGFAWPMLDGMVSRNPLCRILQIRLALRGRNRHPAVRLLRRALHAQVQLRQGRGLLLLHDLPAPFPRPDHRHHPRFGLPHELLRHEHDPRHRLYQDRQPVPVLRPDPRLARRVPDRLRHLVERPLLRYAALHRAGRGYAPRTRRSRELLRRRHRQDDFAPVHQRGHRRHRYDRAGRQPLPLRPRAQHRHDPRALRADLPSGRALELHAAVGSDWED